MATKEQLDGIKLIKDTEIEWYNNAVGYLYDKSGNFAPNTLVGKYRAYNDKFRPSISNIDNGALRINDLWFSIPPQSISLQMSENSIDVPQIRSKHSVKLNTGYGEIGVNLTLTFTDNPILQYTLDEEISYKLIPLMTQLRTMPFIQVENEFLSNQLLDIARNQLQLDEKTIAQSEELRGRASDIMLTYVSHSISTVQESPRIIQLQLQFILFNYLPFMNSVRYVKDYFREGGQLKRDPLKNNKIVRPAEWVYDPFYSKPFYEFFYKEFKRSQSYLEKSSLKITDNNGNIISWYNHSSHSQNLELTYFTYTEVQRAQIPEKYKTELEKSTQSVGNLTTMQNSLSTPNVNFYKLPINISSNNEIVSKFAEPRKDENGKSYMHGGIDISAKMNTPITLTFADGIVDKIAYNNGNAGNSINIRHINGYITKYFHLNKFNPNLKIGSTIKIGDTIGFVGNTGRSKGPHLHYEIWYGGKPIDPLRYKSTNITSNEIEQIAKISLNKGQLNKDGFSDFSEFKDTDKKETKASISNQDELIKYLDGLDPDKWEFVLPDGISETVYIRRVNSYNIDMQHDYQGMRIVSIENMGGNDIPRVPLSGYQYATHQFLGGHIEKLRLNIAVPAESLAKQQFKDFQNINNIVNNNAISYRSVSYLDGLGIKNDFINNICSSEWFSVDNTSISTDPNVPDAFTVSIEFTDYSRIKEYIKRSFEFKQDLRKHEATFYNKFINNLFDIIDYTLNIVTETSSSGISGKPNYLVNTQGNITGRFLKLHLKNAPNDMVAKLTKELFVQLNKINMYSNSQANIYNLRSRFESKLSSVDQSTLYTMIFNSASGILLTDTIKDFILANYKLLYPYLNEFKNTYSIDTINELEQIISPAYVDFDLPPTIDPDYYWFQSQKYNYVDYKHEEFIKSKFSTLQTDISTRFNTYKEQLRHKKVDDIQDNTNNILYQLYGKINDGKDYESMQTGESNHFQQPATNLVVESIDNKTISSGKIGIDNRDINKKRSTEKAESIYGDLGIITKSSELGIKDAMSMGSIEEAAFNLHSENPNYLQLLFSVHAGMHSMQDMTMDMMRCFPTFKVYIIEEDDTEVLAPIRNDLNEYYGLNCIQEIRFVEHDDQPVDVLTLRFLDITGKFTSARFKDKPFTETKKLEVRDKEKENPFEGIMLKEGSRIQFRFGYTNNINNLTTKFNGQVTNINGDRNEFEIICQSFGAELVYERKHSEAPEQIATFNAETKEILTWAISHPEIKHFGRWKLRSMDNLQFSDSTSGLNMDALAMLGNGYYSRFRADGTTQKTWTFLKNEGDINFLAPDESNWAGLLEFTDDLVNNVFDHMLGLTPISFEGGFHLQVPILNEFVKIFDSMFTDYYVHNMTPWDVINEMTYRYPGYIAKVLPFEDRNTVYYGPADGNYFSRKMKLGEKIEHYNWMKKYRAFYEAALDKTIDAKNTWFDVEMPDGSIQQMKGSDSTEYLDLKIIKEGSQYRTATIKPIRQYIPVRSSINIISNNIKADYRSVYTKVEVPYARTAGVSGKKDWNSGDWASGVITMQMNDFLADEDIRTTSIDFKNCTGLENFNGGAYKYGTHELWKQSKNLYKGTLQILAEPTLKPYDYLILDDTHNSMFGPLVVREHILSIAPGEGAISSVTPGMVSDPTNLASMTMLDTVNYYLSSKNTVDDAERIIGGYAPIVLGAGSVYKLGSALALGGVLGAMTPLSAVIALATSMGLASMATKLIFAAKYREPIFLSPLMRNGVPYLIGMQHYKIGTLMEYYEHEWRIFKTGLDNFFDYTSIGFKEASNIWRGERNL